MGDQVVEKGLRKVYRRVDQVTALKGVPFHVGAGEPQGYIGPTGARPPP